MPAGACSRTTEAATTQAKMPRGRCTDDEVNCPEQNAARRGHVPNDGDRTDPRQDARGRVTDGLRALRPRRRVPSSFQKAGDTTARAAQAALRPLHSAR